MKLYSNFQYTDNNHFKFGYYDEKKFVPFKVRTADDEIFYTKYGKCRYQPESWPRECIKAANKIGENFNAKMSLLLSGGIDSEAMVWSFSKTEVDFDINFVRYIFDGNILNRTEEHWAILASRRIGKTLKVFDLDVKSFFNRDNGLVHQYLNINHGYCFEAATTLWLGDQVDGVPVYGIGDPFLLKNVRGKIESSWSFQEKERVTIWYKHFMRNDRPAVPAFFQYTPEQLFAFLDTDEVKLLVSNGIIGAIDINAIRPWLYQKYFSCILRRSLSGYEEMDKLPDSDTINLRRYYQNKFKKYNSSHFIEYDKMMEELSNG